MSLDQLATMLAADDNSTIENKDDSIVNAAENNDNTTSINEFDNTTNESNNTNTVEDENTTWGKALGIDDKLLQVDDDGNIQGIVTNVNGETEIVNLQALVAGYQNNKANTLKSQAIAEERKQIDTVKEQIAIEYKNRLENVNALVKHLETKILGDAKNIDWDRLRLENPGEYAARVQDFNLQRQELANIFAAAEQERTRLQQEEMGTLGERRKAFFQEQANLLIQNNPEWKDPNKMQAAFKDLSEFATSTYGFNMDEFNSVADARVFELLKDAMKYRKGIKIADNKVKDNLPQFTKPSGNKSTANSKLQQLTKRAKTATGAAKRYAETDAIAELLLTGDTK